MTWYPVMATNPYTDDNGVFLNKFGITDAKLLRAAEYKSTTRYAEDILTGKVQLGVQGYGLERLCAIHKHIFQDVYEWAGKPRTVPSYKRLVDSPGQITKFSDPQAIASDWRELEKETTAFVQAKGLSFEQKREAITEIFIKANSIHPFPEGNGRSLQVFMKQLAHEQGLKLDFTKVNAAEWNYASAVSGTYGRLFEHQYLIRAKPDAEPIKKIFSEITSPIDFLTMRASQERQAVGLPENERVNDLPYGNKQEVSREGIDMGKERLLVMNGQRIVQTEKDGAWTNQKVEKAGALKPGIYNLYIGQAADKKQTYSGVIVHADAEKVYQQTGKNFVQHARADFDKVPEIGAAKSISYNAQGKAAVTAEVQKLVRGRSR